MQTYLKGNPKWTGKPSWIWRLFWVAWHIWIVQREKIWRRHRGWKSGGRKIQGIIQNKLYEVLIKLFLRDLSKFTSSLYRRTWMITQSWDWIHSLDSSRECLPMIQSECWSVFMLSRQMTCTQWIWMGKLIRILFFNLDPNEFLIKITISPNN